MDVSTAHDEAAVQSMNVNPVELVSAELEGCDSFAAAVSASDQQPNMDITSTIVINIFILSH